MADILLINVTEGAPAGGFASDGTSNYSYLNSVLPAYLRNDFHYTFCGEPVYYLQLAASIRKQGLSVEVIDGILMNLRITDIKKLVDQTQAKIIGLTMFQANYHAVMNVILYIKHHYPHIKLFSGGTYSSIVYDKLLERHREIDYVVVGDGDEAVPELCKALLNGKDCTSIPGVAFRRDGQVYLTPPVPVELDTVPFLARDFASQIKQFDFSFSMVTSRGCGHGACAFCYLPMYQKISLHPKYRYRSPEKVVAEMVLLRDQYGISRVTFVDEDYFGVHSIGIPRAEAIADLLIEQEVGVTYYVNARISSLIAVIRQGLLPKLAQSGLRYAFIGIESGSDEILRKYKKGITLRQIHAVVDELANYNIKINPGLITFDPDLTPEQVVHNVQMLEYVGYYDVFMFTRKLILLPGIQVGSVSQDWELPDWNPPVQEPPYYKEPKTKLLYDSMIWFRDTIFPIYQQINHESIMTDVLRKSLIKNHFAAFYQVATRIISCEATTLEDTRSVLLPYVGAVEKHA